MKDGNGVVVHYSGIGRIGTVLGFALLDPGFCVDEAINYMDRTNRLRGVRGGLK